MGKTALLDYLADRARVPDGPGCGCPVGDGAAFAGLHQLLAPMLDHLRVAALPDLTGAIKNRVT